MWYVKDNTGFVRGKAGNLSLAMEMAKYIDEFVVITDGVTEIVGLFGVDSIVDQTCPDGVEYSWKKRRP